LCSASGGSAFVVVAPNNDAVYASFTNSGAIEGFDRFVTDGVSYYGNFRTSRLNAVLPGAFNTNGAQIVASVASVGTQTVRKDGASVLSVADQITGYRAVSSSLSVTIGATLSTVSPLVYSYYLDGNVAEIICYNKPLSESDARKVEKYLAAKWGITLAPQVSNADAQDWVNRVYANGGTVSSATAAAVNTFCDAIDAASLRAAMYRTNLFCGGNLNAALVPLYLTPDKTVTNLFQFGTDVTNAAWLAGGNGAITRAATAEVGPLGYGYATKLTTPSAPFDVRQMYQQMPLDGRQVTVSAWMKANSGTRQIQWLAGNVYSDTVTVTTTWQRFTKTFTLPTSTDARTGFSTVSELSDAAGFIYVWGMQCEYGATATSYNQPRYGGTTDTNNGPFLPADYSEASGLGPQATSSTTKYLDTGFAGTSFGATRHVGVFIPAPGYTANNAHSYLGSSGAGGINNVGILLQDNGIRAIDSSGGSYNGVSVTDLLTAGHYVGNTPSGSLTLRRTWRNGVAIGNGGDAAATPAASAMYVFAENRNGTVARRTANGMYGYHFGLDMTSTQAESLRSAFNTFATSIGRPNL
jgi:hypothetical protein